MSTHFETPFDSPPVDYEGPTIVTVDNMPQEQPAAANDENETTLEPISVKELATQLRIEYRLRHEFGEDAVVGEPVGLRELDEELHVEGGRLFCLGGGPGSGKTALALQMARHVGTRRSADGTYGQVAYIFTEMNARDALERMMLEFAQLESNAVRRNVTTETLTRVDRALDILEESGVVLFDAVGRSIGLIVATIRKFRRLMGNARMVVVDNLSGIGGSNGSRRDSMHEFYGSIIRELHTVALTTDLPVWLLAHTKRKDANGRHARPSLEDFALSAVLERFAHAAAIIQAKPEGSVAPAGGGFGGGGFGGGGFAGVGDAFGGGGFGGAPDPGASHELHVMKNRDGRLFVADLNFLGPQMRFEDPKGRTVRPYELPEPERARVSEYRERRKLDLGL